MSGFLLLKLIDLRRKLEERSVHEKGAKREGTEHKNVDFDRLSGSSLNKLCRICARFCDNNFLSIFGEDNVPTDILGNILKCADVSISEEDSLPKKVCDDCCSLLNSALLFRNTCEESDKKLREYVENLKNAPEPVQDEADYNDVDSGAIDDYTSLDIDATLHTSMLPLHVDTTPVTNDWEAELHVNLHSPDDILKPNLRCNKCDLSFLSSSALRKHIMSREHHVRPWTCNVCIKVFNRKSLYNSHMQIHRERKYLCEICGKKCLQRHELKRHLMSHRRITPFHCPFCSYKTWDSCYLRLHETIHTGARKYSCPHCPKKFINNTNMKRHIEKHADPKPYHCASCDMRYTTKYALRDHRLRTHDRIYFFNCTECGVEKNCRKDLQRHMLKVHRAAYKLTFIPTRGPVLYDSSDQAPAGQHVAVEPST